jgi:hypothetical protein
VVTWRRQAVGRQAGQPPGIALSGVAVAWWLASAGALGIGVLIFNAVVYGGPLRSGYRPGEITFSPGAIVPNLRYMPAHLIEAMPVLVLGLGGLAGIAVAWLRARRAGRESAGHVAAGRDPAGREPGVLAGRDLAAGAALGASWLAVWALYATYEWTAAPELSMLQAARFYVPALGAISLLGAWLLVRVPPKIPLTAVTTLAVVTVLCGLGGWAFHDMYQHPFGPQMVVVHGPGGTVRLQPGPRAGVHGPGGGGPPPGQPRRGGPPVISRHGAAG